MDNAESRNAAIEELIKTGQLNGECLKKCKKCKEWIVTFKGCWFSTEIFSTLPCPTNPHLNDCDGDNGSHGRGVVWDVTEMKVFKSILSEWLFLKHGCGRMANRETDEWVSIDVNGNCNREVEIPMEIAIDMYERLFDQYHKNILTYNFAPCQCDFKMRCNPGFTSGIQVLENNPDCPFAKVFDGISKKWSDCYTIIAGGYCLTDFMNEGELTSEEEEDSKMAFQSWLVSMISFYQKKITEI